MSLDKLIRDIVKPLIKTQVVKAVVTSVDKTEDTCEVKLIENDSERFEVQLRAVVDSAKNGLIIYPAEGSNVLVSIIGNNDADCFIVQYSEVDEIVYMDGTNGGLIKIIDLVKKLNNIENDVNSLKTAMSSWIPVAQDGGAALKGVVSSWAGQQLTPTVVGDMENEKFKH